jgi:multiple sugar transport system permease protein
MAARDPVGYVRRLDRYDLGAYVVYAFAFLFFLFPVMWAISMSIRPQGAVVSYPLELVPTEITFDAYDRVVRRSNMLIWVWNSMKIALLEVAGILLVTTPAAYAFSRFDFRGKKYTLFGILLFQMISPVVIVIPLYNMMNQLGLLNTHVGLIALYIGLQVPFSIWLLKSYFDTIPEELDQSARIDGCNRLQTVRYVLLPSVMPGLAVVTIFNFVFSWAEFVMAYTVLNSSRLFTIAMGVFSFQGQYSTDWRAIAAASVVAMIPLLVMFLALQRYFVRGLAEGAVKG